jgi:hypothetical protein
MRLFIFAYTVLFASSLFAADRVARPTGDVLAKAKAGVAEILAVDLMAATQSEKANLSTKILKLSLDTKDNEVMRFAGLLLAREVACEGRYKRTAWLASIAIAEHYLPDGPMDAKSQFAKAQVLWQKSDKTAFDKRLAVQAEAIEWYAYAQDGIVGVELDVCKRRMLVPGVESGRTGVSKYGGSAGSRMNARRLLDIKNKELPAALAGRIDKTVPATMHSAGKNGEYLYIFPNEEAKQTTIRQLQNSLESLQKKQPGW